MRVEAIITKKVIDYLRLKEDKGKQFALEWFRDGTGYRVNVDAWMPYFTLKKAFVVFSAWIESRLWDQDVSITVFSEHHCALLFRRYSYLMLYDVALHLQPKISKSEYLELFEDQWRERASHVGWHMEFAYEGHNLTMDFHDASDRA